MKRLARMLTLVLASSLLSLPALAQLTRLQGTIKDSSGNVYSNGTLLVTYIPSSPGSIYVNGIPTTIPPQTFSLDSTGKINSLVYDIGYITPTGTYNATLCAAGGAPCTSLTGLAFQGSSYPIANNFSPSVVASLVSGQGGSVQVSYVPIVPSGTLVNPVSGAAIYVDQTSLQLVCILPGGNTCNPTGGGGTPPGGTPFSVQFNAPGVVFGGATGVSVDSATTSVLNATGGLTTGTSPPTTACGPGTSGGICAGQTTSPTYAIPTLGVGILQADSTNNVWLQSLNGGSLTPIPKSVTPPMTLSAAGVLATLPCVASGGSHAPGLVPDPGSVVGITRYLREDCTFQVPPGSGSGSATANQGVSFTNQTSVSIPATTSGATSGNVLVDCYDTATPPNHIWPAGWTVDASTFAVTVKFSSSASGYCATNVSGPAMYTASLSSNTTWSISAATHKLGTHIAAILLTDANNNVIRPGSVQVDGSGNITITNNSVGAFTLTVTN